MKKFVVMGAVFAGALAVACGGGGNETTNDGASNEVTNEELAQMVLSLEQFGAEFSTFTPDAENGYKTIEQAAESEDDPVAERADLERSGWVSTYETYYTNPTAEQGSGVLVVGSSVYLFTSPEGAAEYWRDSEAEINDPNSTEGSAELRGAERVDVAVGDQSIGFRLNETIQRDDGSTVPYSGWLLYFRRGQVMGAVVITAAGVDDQSRQALEAKAQTLATNLNERVGAMAVVDPVAGEPAVAR